MTGPDRREILITDVAGRADGASLSTTPRKDHWRIIDYEVDIVGSGRGVALNHWRPGRLTIRLGASGTYRIHLISRYTTVRLKLTGDRCFSQCPPVTDGREKEGWYDVQELLWREADGVSPCFVRGCPIVMYEQPMMAGFTKEHGEDPRSLPEDDPRWLDYCAGIVTLFMRELKAAIGPSCRLAPMIHGTKQLNRRFGMDIETWVRDRIVDDLFIMCHQYDPACDHSQAGPEFLEYDWFQNMPGRERIRLWPMTYMWQMFEKDPQPHCAAMQNWLDQGADGYGFWDAAAMPVDKTGNIWDLGKWPRPTYEQPKRLIARHRLIKYDGYLWDRYTPIEGW